MSDIQKVGGRLFRYKEERAIVEFIEEATPDMYKDDEEWIEKHGYPLWDIDAEGYIVLDSVGLSKENWEDDEARMNYLTEYANEIDSEIAYLSKDFIKEAPVWYA